MGDIFYKTKPENARIPKYVRIFRPKDDGTLNGAIYIQPGGLGEAYLAILPTSRRVL
ncbi:MAG: hypothetical protein LBJ60_06890 [Tannerellaceae bacterium]|jgi:hypothetical protein|nr:hypothetical protein [Tannerellaceae bacterium]